MTQVPFPKLLSSQIAFDVARTILDGFDKHYRLFREASQAARRLFEAGDWATAQQAARQLGISRQRYYKWESRALRALLTALENQPRGRPRKVQDPEKHQLQVQVQELQKQVHVFQQKEKLRQIIKSMEESRRGSSTKKNSK